MASWRGLYLHHFSQIELKTLQSSLGHLSIHEESPQIVEVPGGFVPKPEAPDRTIGVFDRDIRLVARSLEAERHLARGRWNPDGRTLRGVRRDRRAAYYLGVGEWQFGHFLLETLSRAWAWDSNTDDLVPVIQPGMSELARAFYALIPGLLQRIAPLRESVQFDRVVVPGAAFVIGRRAHVAFKGMCMQMAEKAIKKRHPASEQPLYLSRTRLHSTGRHAVVGELRLERFLESQGFAIAHPEQLALSEQIALFNRHKWLVAPMGSACHTRLFALDDTNLVMLAHPRFLRNFVLCDGMNKGTTHYLNVLSIPELGVTLQQNFWEPFMLDEQRLLADLKDLGLVKSGAALEGSPPSLDEYRTQWIDTARRQVLLKPDIASSLLSAIDKVAASIGKGAA